jgi:hypothetical protein
MICTHKDIVLRCKDPITQRIYISFNFNLSDISSGIVFCLKCKKVIETNI